MDKNENECVSCDLKYRCNRKDESKKIYICPIGGPYDLVVYKTKDNNENKRN